MPNYSERPSLAESFRLRIAELRRAGALVQGERRQGELQFNDQSGQPALRVEFVADLRSASGFLELRHLLPDQVAGEPYRVDLIEIAMVRRSEQARHATRWVAICPVRRTHAGTLYCPAQADRFLSSRAYQLVVESDRLATAKDRAVFRLQLARQRLARATLPKGCYKGARGPSAGTIAKLRAAVADAELRAHRATAARAR